MARRNIEILPPFMNFGHMTSWLDEHLKRRLHEMLGDMGSTDLESVNSACFQNERDSSPLIEEYIDKFGVYFEQRLLRGCLFHAIITDQQGELTEYSKLIKEIAWCKTNKLSKKQKEHIREQISKLAQDRYDVVLECWCSPEFQGFASYEWAKNCLNDNNHKEMLCNAQTGEVIKDALEYINLILNWHMFTRSIERLSFIASKWLFAPVE